MRVKMMKQLSTNKNKKNFICNSKDKLSNNSRGNNQALRNHSNNSKELSLYHMNLSDRIVIKNLITQRVNLSQEIRLPIENLIQLLIS